MRNSFDEQLASLNRELISMGGLCENAIARAAEALTNGNTELAKTLPKPLTKKSVRSRVFA